jgi:hypothetical protein
MQDKYEVGYGKPPKATRFGTRPQPNRSPKPRTTNDIPVDVAATINRPLTITQNGKMVRMHPHEAMMLGLLKSGLSGKIRAMKEFFAECKKAGLFDAPVHRTTGVITVPKGIPVELAAYLVKECGPPPWDEKFYNHYKAEYERDCADIERLLEQEKGRRNESGK